MTSIEVMATARELAEFLVGEYVSCMTEDMGEEPRDVHLRHSDLLRDLRLSQFPEEPVHEDCPFAFRQSEERRPEGFVVVDSVERGVVLAERVSD